MAALSMQENRCDRATAQGRKILRKNRSTVLAALGESAFGKKFKTCFSARMSANARTMDVGPISRFFRQPQHFRLLLTPWQRVSKTPK
jgi:hypothetical protein